MAKFLFIVDFFALKKPLNFYERSIYSSMKNEMVYVVVKGCTNCRTNHQNML